MIREMLGIAEGILQDLHNDHSEIDTMLERIEDSDSGTERTTLFLRMKTSLLAHSDAEQEVLYRRMVMSDDEEARKFALEGENEHDLIAQQLRKMSSGDKLSEAWASQLGVLRELLEHHVDEEEGAGFGCARDAFEKDELEAMGTEFQRRKQELMTRAG